jgi:hypothetical protein
MAGHTLWLRTLSLAIIAMLVTGCVRQPVDESQLGTGEEFAEVAEPLDPADAQRIVEETGKEGRRKRRQRARRQQTAAAQDPGSGGRDPGSATGSGGGTQATGGSPAAGGGDRPAAPQDAPFGELAAITDRTGDAGQAPDYADAQRVVIESNGTLARVSVVMAGDIPAALADGEVQGVGIDFYRSAGRESDFQLFADGGYKGWRAFVHSPEGTVPYDGVFRVGGRVLVFEVPWTALGGTDSVSVGAFVDWAEKGTLLGVTGNDRAPNDGTVTVRPARG